jgi:hypothetical protein
MSADSSSIVSKVWNYAHVLKNAGGGYHSQKIKPTITLRRLPFDDMESEFKCGRPEGSFHKPHYTQVQIS